MTRLANALARTGFRVRRFEFPFMVERRATGKRRPPDRPPVLLQAWRDAVEAVCRMEPDAGRLWIGGRSLGGRMASQLLAEDQGPGMTAGALVFGYPFHPPGKSDRWRIDHFPSLSRPLWIAQGERDPFGRRHEVESRMPFEGPVYVNWVTEGDHELVPTRRSGLDTEALMTTVAEDAMAFVQAEEAGDQ